MLCLPTLVIYVFVNHSIKTAKRFILLIFSLILFDRIVNLTNILFYVLAVYNWQGDVKHGLPLEIGDSVEILEEYNGKITIEIFKLDKQNSVGCFDFAIVDMEMVCIALVSIPAMGPLC